MKCLKIFAALFMMVCPLCLMAQEEQENKEKGPHYSEAFIPAFHFEVAFPDLDSKCHLACSSVSGLDRDLQVEEIQEGGVNTYSHRLPKPVKYKNLVLKRALTVDDSKNTVLTWIRNAMENFVIAPQTITVSMLNIEHKAVRSWTIYGAYPVKTSLSTIDASKNEILIDTIELAFQRFD